MCLPYLISRVEKAMKTSRQTRRGLSRQRSSPPWGRWPPALRTRSTTPWGGAHVLHLLKEELADATKGGKTWIASSRSGAHPGHRSRNPELCPRGQVERAPTDINELVRSAASATLATSPNGKFRVEFRLDPSLGLQQVDGGQLRQSSTTVEERVEAMPRWRDQRERETGREFCRDRFPTRAPAFRREPPKCSLLLHHEEGGQGHGLGSRSATAS